MFRHGPVSSLSFAADVVSAHQRRAAFFRNYSVHRYGAAGEPDSGLSSSAGARGPLRPAGRTARREAVVFFPSSQAGWAAGRFHHAGRLHTSTRHGAWRQPNRDVDVVGVDASLARLLCKAYWSCCAPTTTDQPKMLCEVHDVMMCGQCAAMCNGFEPKPNRSGGVTAPARREGESGRAGGSGCFSTRSCRHRRRVTPRRRGSAIGRAGGGARDLPRAVCRCSRGTFMMARIVIEVHALWKEGVDEGGQGCRGGVWLWVPITPVWVC